MIDVHPLIEDEHEVEEQLRGKRVCLRFEKLESVGKCARNVKM